MIIQAGETQGTNILNNVLYNGSTCGICISGQYNDTRSFSNTTISGNVILNVNSNAGNGDSPAIGIAYGWNIATNINVTNNYIRDCGINANKDYCIYDTGSAANIIGNVIAGSASGMIFYQSNNNMVVSGNIIDLGSTLGNQAIIDYQFLGSPIALEMSGNTFTGNIIIVGGSAGGGNGYQILGSLTGCSPTSACSSPDIEHNMYYSYGSSTIVYTGWPANNLGSLAPLPNGSCCGDPLAVTGQDPLLSGWTYRLASNSPAYSSPVNFTAIPGNWGPPGYVIPQTGTAPSFPH